MAKKRGKQSLEPKPTRVILGAGVCGLYAALRFLRNGEPVVLVEKEDFPGGLAAGNQRGENFYDLGVHMLHAFDSEVFETVSNAMGEERIEVELDAKIRWAGAYYRYPLQFGDMLRGMNPLVLSICVMGLFRAQLQDRLFPNREPANAEEALIELYGSSLYHFFFEEFTHRYWGVHPSNLSATFIKSKMPRLSAVDMIKKQLEKFGFKERAGRAVESALLSETLHYSRTGAEALPRCLAKEVLDAGGELLLGHELVHVTVGDDGLVSRVKVRDCGRGAIRELACRSVLSTIPVPSLVRGIEPAVPSSVTSAAAKLAYKPIVIYGLLVRKERALDALYIYYRDRCFHRVGEPKNAGLRVRPDGHTVLIVEMTCEKDGERWRGEEAFREKLLRELEEERICSTEEVVEVHVLPHAHGYPMFHLGFENELETVVKYLEQIPNLTTTGRQGGFTYPNMHQAMRMGADAAEAQMALPVA